MYRNFWRVWLFFMITVVVVVAKEFKKRETLSKKEHTRLIWCLVLLKLNQLHRNCVSFLLYYFFCMCHTQILFWTFTHRNTQHVCYYSSKGRFSIAFVYFNSNIVLCTDTFMFIPIQNINKKYILLYGFAVQTVVVKKHCVE